MWLVVGVAVGSLAALAIGLLAISAFGTDAPATAMAPPRFVEEADAAGLHHVYDGDFTFFVGGGVAAFDCDDDGRPDLYFAGGTNPAALYRNESPIGGALRFAQVPDPITDLTQVVGAYPVDIDGDGRIDLAVLRFGENVLLRGLGDCRFERGNEAWGFDGGDAWTAAFSAKWEGSANAADPRLRQLPRPGREPAGADDLRGQRSSCGRRRARRPTPNRYRSRPVGARCRSCSATGTDPVAAT